MRTPMKITVGDADLRILEKWLTSRAVDAKQKQRAKIILMSADGLPTSELMRKLKVSNPTLNLWRRRYQEGGIEALIKGKSRPPGITPLAQEKIQNRLRLRTTSWQGRWGFHPTSRRTGVDGRLTSGGYWRHAQTGAITLPMSLDSASLWKYAMGENGRATVSESRSEFSLA